MSSGNYKSSIQAEAGRLRIRISPSPALAAILFAVHSGAAVCAVVYLPAWWAVAPVAIVAASLIFHLRRDALLLSADAIVGLAFRDQGRCELEARDLEVLEAGVLGSTFVSPLLIVVNLQLDEPSRRRSVVILPDGAPAEDRRALRVWLRHRVAPAG